MAKNSNMHAAKKAKNDEFYTQLTDIERECFHYREHFKDKIIFCNCDDPEWSNFWKYFEMNFEFFGLKKLIATHYSDIEKTYKLELYRNDKNELVKIKTDLQQNGDFRSPECIDILNSCDIVVTNPPFSLAKDYLEILINSGKKFLFIGNQNSATNVKEFFKQIKDNKLWLGISMNGSNRYFQVPDHYPLTEKTCKIVDNKKYAFVNGVIWFTNLEHNKRNEPLKLGKKYYGNEREYPKYDNYDVININKVLDIPEDYYGIMGVPITFLHSYCPDQFEILGMCNDKYYRGNVECYAIINNKAYYARLLIKRKI